MSKKFLCDYKIQGKGPVLFLIHGIGASKDAWSQMIEDLSNFFLVITYDLRGHGNSIVTDKNFTIEKLIDDLENLRTHINIKKGHFVGHSLGGMIAPLYAIKYPKRVLKIGMLSTIAGRSDKDRKKVLNVIEEMENTGIEKTLKTLTSRWFTDKFIMKRTDLVQKRLKQVLETDPEVFLNVFKIYANTEIFPLLKNITQPTLLLTGENDLGCSPKHNEIMSEQIPLSEFIIVPYLKHSLLIESPNQINQHLINFLNKKNHQ